MEKIETKTLPIKQQTIMKRIESRLSEKILFDEKLKESLLQEELQKLKKHKKIQEQMEKINRQNLIWIKKLEQFDEIIQKKKTSASISVTLKEQKSLLQNYHKLQLQLQNIKAVKKQIRKLQNTDLHEISIKNSQISHVIKQSQHSPKKQSQSTPKIHSVEQKPDHNLINKKLKKTERKTKSIQQLKQLGRKYLQFAKHAQKLRSEKRLLNLQNKNIDYGSEMKELIKLKVEDLSKKPELEKQQFLSNLKKRTFKQTSTTTLTQRTQETREKSRSKSNFSSFEEKKNRFSLKNIN